MVLSAPFLIWMSYMGPDERTSAVILLVTYWTVQSLNNSGFRVNHIDIAPRYLLQGVGLKKKIRWKDDTSQATTLPKMNQNYTNFFD